jgi:peptidoglycan hydrolase-like protein with peptidoglycan-binding domain
MTIVQKQCLLKYLGYYNGEVDGKWGKLSDAATKELQKASGITEDGFGAKTEEVAKTAVFYGKFKQVVVYNQPAKWFEIKHFRREEFACKCGKCGGFPVEPSLELARVLDKLRDHFGKPAHINSGVRCAAHNKAVGGASNSQHLYGTAADIATIEGTTPAQMYAYAEKLLPNTGGIGIYPWGIHVDVRKNKARF